MTEEEHRETQRHRTLKSGLIVFNGGRSTIECTIRNMSEGGAQLNVAGVVGIPDTFVLQLSDKSTRNCAIVWRRTTELGVKFEGP